MLPNAAAAEEPLTAATIAVSKATELLTRAAQARGRRRTDRPAQEALAAIEEARAAVARVRAALLDADTEPRRAEGAAAPAEPSGESSVEARCLACGETFAVHFPSSEAAPLVAMPVACPRDDCEGVTAVEIPAGAQARVALSCRRADAG